MGRVATIKALLKNTIGVANRGAKAAKRVSKSLDSYKASPGKYTGYSARNFDSGIGMLGFGAGAHLAGTSFQDAFGDQLSPMQNFLVGGATKALTTAAAMRGFTHFGRAGMAKFGGGNELRTLRKDLPGRKKLDKAKRRAQKAARIQDDLDQDFHATGEALSYGLRPTERVVAWSDGAGRYGVAPRHRGMPGATRKTVDRLNRTQKGGTLLREKPVKVDGVKQKSNMEKVKNVLAVERAQKFSSLGILAKGFALPGMLLGPMLGKGTLGKVKDPVMSFIGKSMPLSIYGGALAGIGGGIWSRNRGNGLGPVAGPRSRQSRSFSNINHNATLSAHGMNSNVLR